MHSAILKFIPPKVSLVAGKVALQASKQSPHILFGAGMVGFGATIYLASKAALKLDQHIDKVQEDLNAVKEMHHDDLYAGYSPSDYRRDMLYIHTNNVYQIAKMYSPTIVVGVGTIICLTRSHQILSNRNTALMAAYSVLDKSYAAYRKKVIAELGEDKDREFRYPTETYKHVIVDDKGKVLTDSEKTRIRLDNLSGYARFFDELCESWKPQPEFNLIFLRAQQNWANDILQARGHLFLNEVYDMLGIPRTKAGAVVGWTISNSGDNYVDFGLFDGDNPAARDFVNGREGAILLDFNVDGVIYDKIGD